MLDKEVPAHLCRIGKLISGGWERVAAGHGLRIKVTGIPPLTTFAFDDRNSLQLHTLFTQEMLNRGFLASKSVYVSYSHSEDHVQRYLQCVDEVFELVKKAVESNNVSDLLTGPVAHEGFKRLA